MKKLWEVDHPYYCNEASYWKGETEMVSSYKSWGEFFDAEGDSEVDLNLVFRWDWRLLDGGDYYSVEPGDDPNYRDGCLHVFFLTQRKGIFRSATVEVCQADEPAIREWLQGRFNHLLEVWAPLVGSEA